MHKRGHLRTAFEEWVYEGMEDKPAIDGKAVDVKWLLGQLWDCSDIMPSDLCEELEMTPGSTCTQAAQPLMAAINEENGNFPGRSLVSRLSAVQLQKLR